MTWHTDENAHILWWGSFLNGLHDVHDSSCEELLGVADTHVIDKGDSDSAEESEAQGQS